MAILIDGIFTITNQSQDSDSSGHFNLYPDFSEISIIQNRYGHRSYNRIFEWMRHELWCKNLWHKIVSNSSCFFLICFLEKVTDRNVCLPDHGRSWETPSLVIACNFISCLTAFFSQYINAWSFILCHVIFSHVSSFILCMPVVYVDSFSACYLLPTCSFILCHHPRGDNQCSSAHCDHHHIWHCFVAET